MRKKTRTIIALTISWELFLTKEKKEAKLYYISIQALAHARKPIVQGSVEGTLRPMGWDYKEDWEGKTDIKGFSSVRAALQDEWYRCTALRRDWTRKRCIEAWIRKKSPLSVFKLRTNCAPKVREEIWLTDIHIKRNRRSSSSRARNGSRSSIFFLFPYRERCLRL